MFSLSHARLIVLIATTYSIYFVKVRVGWLGVFLSINLAFLSNDVLNYLVQRFDNVSETAHYEEPKESKPVMEEDLSGECEYSNPSIDSEKVQPCKSSSKSATTSVINQKEVSAKRVVKEETSSADEMTRILNCTDHYQALGIPRHTKIDTAVLKKEYKKKAMLVHPDKNMGSPLASESFKKLQCAYEVLSDSTKKRDYDEQLRKEESRTRGVCQESHGSSRQQCLPLAVTIEYFMLLCSPVQTIALKNQGVYSALSVDCCQYHQAKDGDGWVEYKGSLVFDRPQKLKAENSLSDTKFKIGAGMRAFCMITLSTVEIPRAFVCAESKIFDVSEWAICQGMACRPNTHRPSFHVNMVGLEKTQRSNTSRYPWDLDAEMIDEDEEFELWLQQALASGLFCETSKRRKSWSPFKLPQKKSKRQWRRSST
ncbi:hypothetical protein GOBAR_AA18710 [Gossypium barbadense]|uniref:J domain-containing protein n=1 Tax=Gossypium barbadense TaxID=3634 RepID=A0A2P5XF19_GOSBA|nr:hypothetical protein GOBAR_AA18710 [Gossypium barbadense]